MSVKVVSSGQAPLIRNAVNWLESRGIAPSEIRSVSIEAEVGEPMFLSVVLVVPDPDELA